MGISYVSQSSNKAQNIKIDDTSNHFDSNTVEGALKELAERKTGSGTDVDLSNYATKQDLASKANINHTHNNYSETTHNHNSQYAAKSSEHNHTNKNALDKVTDNKINEWNGKANSNHYHDDYAPSTHNHDFSYYKKSETYTKLETNNKISEEIAKAQIGGGNGEIDLSAYATKVDLEKKSDKGHTHSNYSETTHNHNDSYANKSSEHTHSNKVAVDKVTDEKINEWNNKANANHVHTNYSENTHTHDDLYAKTADTYNKSQVDTKISEIELTPGEEGKGWLFGQNIPGSDIGRNGDLYYKYNSYDVYRKNGSSWQISGNLKGGKGDTGNTGLTPNITIGNVSTLEPGQPATVSKRGTNEAPIFDFGIPKGRDGSGGNIDLSNYATKKDLESKASVNHLHPGYALDDHEHSDLYYRKNEVYTKGETETKILEEILNVGVGGTPDLSNYATKQDLAGKANINHSHNEAYYQKSETYTKSEIDSKITSSQSNIPKHWIGTKEEYDRITSKDTNTIYFIKES